MYPVIFKFDYIFSILKKISFIQYKSIKYKYCTLYLNFLYYVNSNKFKYFN